MLWLKRGKEGERGRFTTTSKATAAEAWEEEGGERKTFFFLYL